MPYTPSRILRLHDWSETWKGEMVPGYGVSILRRNRDVQIWKRNAGAVI